MAALAPVSVLLSLPSTVTTGCTASGEPGSASPGCVVNTTWSVGVVAEAAAGEAAGNAAAMVVTVTTLTTARSSERQREMGTGHLTVRGAPVSLLALRRTKATSHGRR